MGTKRYFEILEIQPTKDEKVIRRAYRKLALRYHPDKNKSDEAHVNFIQISEAHENLLAAIEYSNRTEEEKKEYTRGKPHQSFKSKPKKSEAEIYEERLRQARKRYEEMKHKEEQENEEYYQKISSGRTWKLFRVVMIGCLIFSILFILDSQFLPSRWQKSDVIGHNRVMNYGGISYSRIVPLKLITGEKIWVKPSFASSAISSKSIFVERSYFFRDVKTLWTWESGKWYSSVSDFSVLGTFPLVPIFLIIPFVTFIIKGRTLSYSLLFNISLYMYGIILFALLIVNDRWMHLLTLGLL